MTEKEERERLEKLEKARQNRIGCTYISIIAIIGIVIGASIGSFQIGFAIILILVYYYRDICLNTKE